MKPWKPKRPVPTSRDPPTKLIFDEADDFPRGGGKGESIEKKKQRKRMRKNKEVPSVPPGGHSRPDRLCWTVTGEMQGSKQEKGEKKRKRRNRAQRIADKKLEAQMYPTDENLFIIKQRKRNR